MNRSKRSETDLRTWSTRELKKRAVSLHGIIYQLECYATHDMVELDAVVLLIAREMGIDVSDLATKAYQNLLSRGKEDKVSACGRICLISDRPES